MEQKRKWLCRIASLLMILGAIGAHYMLDPWGFYWKVSPEERALRLGLVQTAEGWLGCQEADGTHKPIIDLYNSHKPLAMDYEVLDTDSWCAVFVSTAAIQQGLTDIIPTECGCERQIELFKALGRWEEDDNAIPLPGDLIYFDWDMESWGEARGWADHVGIVVGTKWPFIKVIEGNRADSVSYHILPLGEKTIRGYARPDYTGSQPNTQP